MRRLAVVALLLGITLPVCAQRGGARGGGGFHGGSTSGFAGRSAPAFHGGFGSTPSSRFGTGSRLVAPGSMASRQFVSRYGGASGFPASRARSFSPAYGMRSGARRDTGRPAYVRGGRDWRDPHHPHRPVYRSGFVYAVPQYGGWIGSTYFGYPDDSGYDDGASGPPDSGYTGNGAYVQPEDYQQPDDSGPQPPYEAPVEPMRPSVAPAPAAQNSEAITLVFKDGRAPEQIHNYILSKTTLSVLDGRHRDIPVDQLDLAATEKLNREAGVDFRLPDLSR